MTEVLEACREYDPFRSVSADPAYLRQVRLDIFQSKADIYHRRALPEANEFIFFKQNSP